MAESTLHTAAVWTEIGLAVAAFAALLFVTAPYGRHSRGGWGPTIPNAAGWVVMESPAVLLFAAVYLLGDHALELVPAVFAGMWMLHYANRTFVFPFRVRTRGKRMPLVIAAMAFAFNVLNAYVIARWISEFGRYGPSWLRDPRFVLGAAVFAVGTAVNHRADTRLISLRSGGRGGYRIPRGGMFEYVSSPNYLGEILEWSGYALATWSLAGLAFALFTAANVGPRAFANHRWYRATFPDYPESRKALIPLLW
jgi:protein-S-isoprenylcysteine O-methyltransferase Ste14